MKLAWNLPDGSVTVFGAAPKEQLERAIGKPARIDGVDRRVLTDDEYRSAVVDRIIATGVLPPEASDIVVLPDDWTPLDRSFRSAWKKDGTAFDYDMEKCREITKARLERDHATILEQLEQESLKAIAAGDASKAAAVREHKEKPIDFSGVDAAKSIEELKAIKLQ